MYLSDVVCVSGGVGALVGTCAAFPVQMPITLASAAITSGVLLICSYVSKKIKYKTTQQASVLEETTETQTLDDVVETPAIPAPAFEDAEDEQEDEMEEEEAMEEPEEIKPKSYALPLNIRQDSKYENKDEDTPTIVRTSEGWKTFGCPPKGNESIYEYVANFLSQNPELILTRENSLIDVEPLDPNAEFYYSPEQNKVYVIGKKVPSKIENWEVYGAKYAVKDVPPPGSIQLESIIEGKFTGKCIYLKNPLPGTSPFIKNSVELIEYLRKGVMFCLKGE